MSSCCSAVSPPGCSRASRRCPRSARRCLSASSDMITAAPPPPSPPARGPGCWWCRPPMAPRVLRGTTALWSPHPKGVPLVPSLPHPPCCHLYATVPCCPLAPGLPHPLCPRVLPYDLTQAAPLCPMSPRVPSRSPTSPFPQVVPLRSSLSPLLHVPLFPSGLPCITPFPLPACPPRCPCATVLTVLPHAHIEALLEAASLALPTLGLGDGAALGEGAGEADALVDGAPGGTQAPGPAMRPWGLSPCPPEGGREAAGAGEQGLPGWGALPAPRTLSLLCSREVRWPEWLSCLVLPSPCPWDHLVPSHPAMFWPILFDLFCPVPPHPVPFNHILSHPIPLCPISVRPVLPHPVLSPSSVPSHFTPLCPIPPCPLGPIQCHRAAMGPPAMAAPT